ncbi:MAG: rhamnulokinase family protein [Phycisphaerae bacterium]
MGITANYLAFDLGASSGRAVLGAFDGEHLSLEEIHRFPNRPVALQDKLYWNAFGLFEEIKAAIARCTQREIRLDAIGIDTWGVDFALLARGGELLDMPRHYRDRRTRGVMERTFGRVPRARIYERTGIQLMPLNTLYQLLAVAEGPARLLSLADRLLFMPDLFAYWLTGEPRSERTIASTSQMLDPRTGEWDLELLEALGLPAKILPAVEKTGTIGATLLREVADGVGQASVPLIYTACHDTAAAVAAVPAGGENWAYISSGTWSLVGMELASPLISPETLRANFTNEAGVAGTTRFLRNVAGLWLVQECRRMWASQGHVYSHAELTRMAAAAPPLRSLVDPDLVGFGGPGDVPSRICALCQESGQPPPDSPGAVIRCVLESLALKYRYVVEMLQRLTGRAIEVIHVVGGGVKNELLNRFAANATGIPVIAGPVEATAAGNAMVQAMAQGRVSSVGQLRQVIAASSETRRHEPEDVEAWTEAYGRFGPLLRD